MTRVTLNSKSLQTLPTALRGSLEDPSSSAPITSSWLVGSRRGKERTTTTTCPHLSPSSSPLVLPKASTRKARVRRLMDRSSDRPRRSISLCRENGGCLLLATTSPSSPLSESHDSSFITRNLLSVWSYGLTVVSREYCKLGLRG